MSVVKGFVVKDSVKINDFEERSVGHVRLAISEGCRKYDKEKKEYVNIEGRSPLYISVEYWGTKEDVHGKFDSMNGSRDLYEATGLLCMKSYKREDGTESATPFMQALVVAPKKSIENA